MAEKNNDHRLVRQSYCKKCNGWIRRMALELVDSKNLKNFEKEVKEYDLEVENITLKEVKEQARDLCECEN